MSLLLFTFFLRSHLNLLLIVGMGSISFSYSWRIHRFAPPYTWMSSESVFKFRSFTWMFSGLAFVLVWETWCDNFLDLELGSFFIGGGLIPEFRWLYSKESTWNGSWLFYLS